ncbi:MAG: ribonuclease P protein component [Verrucomicrobia bacterium]|nr:ribonuclease P protein component [Verrucomicrobiota bacterium]
MATEPEFSEPRPVRARFRFPKAAHLFRASEFKAVREGGALQRGKWLFVSVLTGREAGRSRFGLITSRRVGPAVERNAVRRRLREIVRHSRDRLIDGAWFVLTARPGAARATLAQLQQEWERLVGRLRAWREPSEPKSAPPAPPAS